MFGVKRVHGAAWATLCFAALFGRVLGQEATTPDEAGTRQYAAAVALQNRELYDLAAEEWLAFIKDYPSDPRIDRGHHYLGICYLKNQQLDKALATFDKVLRDYPQFPLLESTYLYRGVTQYSLGRAGNAEMFDHAARTLSALIEKFPQGKSVPQAWFYLGESLYARGKREEAADKYAEVLQANPPPGLAADAMYALGVCQQELARHDQARQTYGSFLKQFPDHRLAVEVGMRQGETLLAQKRYAEAEKLFKAAASAPNFAHADFATLQLGISLSAQGQHESAASVFGSLLKSFPESQYAATARLELGKTAYLAGDYAAAKTILSKVMEGRQAIATEAIHWLALTYLKEKNPAVALPLVEQGLADAANTPMAVQLALDKADLLYEIPDRRAEASALYAEIAAKHPQSPLAAQASYMAAFAALGRGDYSQALTQAASFLRAYPGNTLEPDVTYVAAESYLQLSEHSQAEKLYRQLADKFPTHADVGQWKVRIALALLLQKKYEETVAAAQAVLSTTKAPQLIAEARYLAGTAQLELNQLEMAIASLKASLQADSKWRQADEAFLALAQAQRQANDIEAARATLSALARSNPESKLLDRATYRLAEYSYAAKDFEAAVSHYRRVALSWPNSELAPYALYGLGWSQLSRNEFQAAAESLSGLLERFPRHDVAARARYARALARQRLNEFSAAIDDLQHFLQANPPAKEAADARYLLGICQAALEQRAEAVATFQSILSDFPDYSGADKTIYELAWVLKELGKEKEAADWFTRLSSNHPDSALAAESLFQSGELLYQQEDYDRAASAYDAAVRKAGQSELGERAAHKLGWALFRQDRFDDASRAFAAQRATYPAGLLVSDATFMQAECLFKQSKFAEAIPIYREVKNPAGKEFGALALLHAGQAAGQLKDWELSRKLLEQFQQEFPQSEYLPEALYELGWAYQNLGQLEKALGFYRMVPDKTNREVAARAWFMSGQIYFDKKDHREAIRCFLKTAIGYSFPQWQANAHYEAGRCFEAIDKKEQAIQSYQEVTTKFPQSDKAPLAQKRLDALTSS